MASAGEVNLIFLVKFKDHITEEDIKDFTLAYEKLVQLVEPMLRVQYGKDLGSANFQQGFTHVYEPTFTSAEGVAEFLVHPAHAEFLEKQGGPKLKDFIVVDYKPIISP